ncbi:uncharacterized protein EI90DRAFT_3033544 [Cantharellus anzutake]|uniref:uncharacterized protein n=1 Tax=Cantharellus anzutake TaxID=1750568 RepID=UPI0019037825|nr:uncharacterized protein EI90DRAFT_3033544 [Cantharellus anzutake]KAF8341335.1 hypothetical protein EI90DRAFT_3033544 [Cantharellus anzutake]
MATAYLSRYPDLIDWSNVKGKTALHVASLKGNEGFVRMLCDHGADFDLPDEEGNTPLHFASAWGHVSIVQLLIERGCQFVIKNNYGFTASDYAFSNNTMNVLQDTARSQFESNKRARRNIYAQAASRGSELQKRYEQMYGGSIPRIPSSTRLRSGSGASVPDPVTDLDGSGTSYDSTKHSASNHPYQPLTSSTMSHASSSAVPPLPPKDRSPMRPQHSAAAHSDTPKVLKSQRISPSRSLQQLSSSGTDNSSEGPPSSRRQQSIDLALSPVASKVRQRDADAIAQYLSRTRTTSIESGSLVAPSTNGSSSMSVRSKSPDGEASYGFRSTLRPSTSASVLRSLSETSPSKHPSEQSNMQHRYRSTTFGSLPETTEEIKLSGPGR